MAPSSFPRKVTPGTGHRHGPAGWPERAPPCWSRGRTLILEQEGEVNARFGGTLPAALGCSASHSAQWSPLSGMPLVGRGRVEVTIHGEPGSPQRGA